MDRHVPRRSDALSHPALDAARRARAVAGDEASGADDARRDAFVALVYGMATTFAARDAAGVPGNSGAPLDERVDALALTMVRDALGLGFRDADRGVAAVADALVAATPDPAVLGLVHAGAGCAGDWLAGDLRAFESQVLQATAGDAFASGRALRPRR